MALDPKILFRYHRPTPDQIPLFDAITKAAESFAEVIIANTPEGPEQTIAIRHVQDARFRANAAIAIHDATEQNAETRPPMPSVALYRDTPRSSNVAGVGWEGTSASPDAKGELSVRFKSAGPDGGVYIYSNVPRALYEEIIGAESVGKTINAKVVKNPAYKARKVSDVDLPRAESE